MPREIYADVNAGFTLVECNREIDERKAKHEETIPHFQRALQLNPDYSKAQKNLKIAISKLAKQ